jgi:hypothetical protein
MEAFKFIDVNQNTDEWFAMRAGRLTSSNLGKIMANFGKAFGEPAKNYAWNIANEQITGEPISSDYSNAHMERGHEQEPIARMIYEDQTFCDVTNGGFFESEFIGCSPDGLVGDNGVIEIKSVISSVHGKNVKRQGLDPAYRWQFIGNLKFTGRDWLDFISYCSTYPDDKQLFIHRIKKEDLAEEFKMLDERIAQFKKLVDECKVIILESKYDNY